MDAFFLGKKWLLLLNYYELSTHEIRDSAFNLLRSMILWKYKMLSSRKTSVNFKNVKMFWILFFQWFVLKQSSIAKPNFFHYIISLFITLRKIKCNLLKKKKCQARKSLICIPGLPITKAVTLNTFFCLFVSFWSLIFQICKRETVAINISQALFC